MKRTLPYGLLFDLLKFFKKKGMEYTVDDSVKELFKPVENIKFEYKQKFFPRDYQLDCIETAIKRRRGIILSPTGSGKSAIISYIISNLLDNKLVKNALIIVPTLSLIEQFKSDLLDYGIEPVLIGIANKDHKEFNKVIVIST
jgi:superfamily II DNA or RNA helicase